MKQFTISAGLILGLVVFSGLAEAQRPGEAPTASDIYCAGFYSAQPIASAMMILPGETDGFKHEYGTGDTVYLNQGRQAISAPGTQYLLVRPVKDVNETEFFPGQNDMIEKLGTLYAEVGRIRVEIVHERSAAARIEMACDPIHAGDIAVPFETRTVSAYKTPRAVADFAPPSGKATGLIVASREFKHALGEGEIVYLTLGEAQGVQVGNYVRIFRDPANNNDPLAELNKEYMTKGMGGVSVGHRLTEEELTSLPRKVIGEIQILSVRPGTSTGIITFSRSEVVTGDFVELE